MRRSVPSTLQPFKKCVVMPSLSPKLLNLSTATEVRFGETLDRILSIIVEQLLCHRLLIVVYFTHVYSIGKSWR